MKGCYRPLLVFSANGDDLRLRRQVEMLDAAADDMMDRFVLFTPIVPDGKRVSTPADSPYTVLNPKEMAAARAQFHIPTAEFTVLLLDEDGTVKTAIAKPGECRSAECADRQAPGATGGDAAPARKLIDPEAERRGRLF